MDSAIDLTTGDIVDAEDLFDLDPDGGGDYRCRGCQVRVVPVSYRRENRLRPHFGARGIPHSTECDVEGVEELVRKARTTRLTLDEGGRRFPCPFPDRLVLRTARAVEAAARGGREVDASQPDGGGAHAMRERSRRYAAATIRPLCRTFLRFPFDRDLPLRVFDRSARYGDVFRRLDYARVTRHPPGHIYYGHLRWKVEAEPSSGWLDVTLNDGQRSDDHTLVRPYRVRVLWKDWSAARRRYVTEDVKNGREGAQAAWREGAAEKGWLFFVGRQDAEDAGLFLVDDHRLVCCFVDEVVYPGAARRS